MSFHKDLAGWLWRATPEGCPVCRDEPEPPGNVTIAELPASWLGASPRTSCLRGQCWLLAKPHAVELFDLGEQDLLAFMLEAQRCTRALKQVTGAIKINYEIHGNTVPHLHMHLFPRYMDDPFPGAPIDYRRTDPPVYGPGEFEAFVRGMRDALAA